MNEKTRDLNEIEKRFHVENFPLVILVEPANYCNLKCKMCINKDMKRPRGRIDMDLYRKIVDEMAMENPHSRLWVNGNGEPMLMNYRLYYMIKYAKEHGILNVGLNTNGTLLTDEMIDMLLDSGIDFISIDMDAFTNETFERIRVGANRDQVYHNIKRFIEKKKASGKDKPILEIKIIEMDENREEIPMIIDYWKDYPIRMEVRECFSWAEKVKAPHRDKLPERIACAYAIGHCSIIWDGRVAICGIDGEVEEEIGNVCNESIKEIWTRKNRTVLMPHLNHDWDNLPEICKACTDWMHVGSEKRYLESGKLYNRNYDSSEDMLK